METALERYRKHEEKTKEAARRILEISTELHLTWSEFEQVLTEIKKKAVLTWNG